MNFLPCLWCLLDCSLSQPSLYSPSCMNCFHVSLPSPHIALNLSPHSANTFQRLQTYFGSQLLPQCYPQSHHPGPGDYHLSHKLFQLLAKGFPQIKSIAFYTLHATARTFLIKYRFYSAPYLYNSFPDSKG